MADDSEEWVSARKAIQLLKPVMGTYSSQMIIAARANDGLIQSRASSFFIAKQQADDNAELPKWFWWAFHLERGPAPIEQSLRGAHMLFSRVTLPDALPDTLERLQRVQERWLSPILRPSERPPYIGGWNATAMFMIALFAQPALARTFLMEPGPVLPSGGPTFRGLQLLHQAGVASRSPAGTELDDAAFEPGVLYENNGLFFELRKGRADWSLVDIHSGLYMLGTRRKVGAD
jgi:hypothetical protein